MHLVFENGRFVFAASPELQLLTNQICYLMPCLPLSMYVIFYFYFWNRVYEFYKCYPKLKTIFCENYIKLIENSICTKKWEYTIFFSET